MGHYGPKNALISSNHAHHTCVFNCNISNAPLIAKTIDAKRPPNAIKLTVAASIKDPARALRITLVYLHCFLPTTVLVCAQQNPLSEKCTSSRAHTAHIYSSGLSDTAGKSQIRPPAPSFKSTFCSDDIPWDPSSDCCVTGMSSEAAPVTLQIRALHRPSTARDNARSEYCTSAKERLLYLFITGI